MPAYLHVNIIDAIILRTFQRVLLNENLKSWAVVLSRQHNQVPI